MTTLEYFLELIKYDTQSNPYSNTSPSSKEQLVLGETLVKTLKQIGLDNAYMDEHGYVYGYIQSNCNSDKTIGLIAHMDTSFDASGKNINPQIIENYNGQDILLNDHLLMSILEFPNLKKKTGHTLVVTDGTTLLGADDKAGIAIILKIVEDIFTSNIIHPNLIITFTPDEEIGEGTKNFNYEYYKKRNCNIAYTLDGGNIDEINFENFNAASCVVTINGKSIHPGSALHKMINSQLIAMEFQSMLPSHAVPELTEGYEGFFHLTRTCGSVEKTTLEYIIRNHDLYLFNKQKELITSIAEYLNQKYYKDLITIDIQDSYFNMKELILQHAEVLEYAIKALKRNKIEPTFVPIRGGTDGAHLSFNGLYTPNLGTGGDNFHGPFEYLDVTDMNKMVNVIITLLQVISE